MRVVVCLTGASGVVYGYRLAEELYKRGVETLIVASEVALEILRMEEGKGREALSGLGKVYDNDDLNAPIASGSYPFDAVVVIPCSMKTLACIANGIAANLITRSADVALKERRRLILVVRETPFSLVHIRNMLRATEAGALVMPASPGFYHKPKTIGDLVNHMVGKVLDQIGVEHSLFKRWEGDEEEEEIEGKGDAPR